MSTTSYEITFDGDKKITIFESTVTRDGVTKKVFEFRPTLSTTLSLIGHVDSQGITYLEEILTVLKTHL